MSFHQLLLIVRARWLIAVGIFGAVVVLDLVVSLISQKEYTASASVVIDVKADPVAGLAYPSQLTSGYMATQQDIVTSARVAQRVVKTLMLDQVSDVRRKWQQSTNGRGDIDVWLANNLRKSLIVIPAGESNVINISVRWRDPKAAATLANAFAQAYIDTNLELKVDPAKQYANWFVERASALRTDLEAKQKLLSDFQRDNGITASDDRLDIENARLAELSSQLVLVQGQRQESQSRQQQLGADSDAMPEVLQSPLIATLKAELSQAEAKQKNIETTLGTNHPDYQRVVAEISSLRERITRESVKIVTSLEDTTRANSRREADLGAALEAQKKRVLEFKHKHDEATVLENDVQAAQRNLDVVTQRLAQSNLEGEEQHANIALLTRAAEPLEPSSPNYRLNFMLGILLGAVFGIGVALMREVLDPRIRSDAELLQLSGVPLLGRIRAVRVKPQTAYPVSATLARYTPSAG